MRVPVLDLAFAVLTVVLAAGCGGESGKDTPSETSQETNQAKATTTEETTSPRETTEATTGFEFSVGRTPMDEEEDDSNVVRRREVVVERAPQPPSEPQEEQYPPEPAPDPAPEPEPEVECRFFTQSEFVNADADQKAFIQECDRAAGRVAPSAPPVQEERDANEPPQERAAQPEPQVAPQPQPAPQPSGGHLTCDAFPSPEEAQAALPANPQLDGDNDGLACE